jgi:alpha-tubulin suppressor-like RCC1 family protein
VEGEVYAWGSNEYGQLGIETKGDIKRPEKVAFEQKFLLNESGTLAHNIKISRISVGPCHNFAVSEDGDIYSWGLGSYGQLGNGKFELKQHSPIIINETDDGSPNISAINFPKEKVRKFLSNLVLTPAFDCTFMLISILI